MIIAGALDARFSCSSDRDRTTHSTRNVILAGGTQSCSLYPRDCRRQLLVPDPVCTVRQNQSKVTQSPPSRGLLGPFRQRFHSPDLLSDCGVHFVLMIIVVGQGRIDLCPGKMRMLKVNLLRTPPLNQLVKRDLNNLRVGASDPGDSALVQLNMSFQDYGHNTHQCNRKGEQAGRAAATKLALSAKGGCRSSVYSRPSQQPAAVTRSDVILARLSRQGNAQAPKTSSRATNKLKSSLTHFPRTSWSATTSFDPTQQNYNNIPLDNPGLPHYYIF
jgi:hypothetical protein